MKHIKSVFDTSAVRGCVCTRLCVCTVNLLVTVCACWASNLWCCEWWSNNNKKEIKSYLIIIIMQNTFSSHKSLICSHLKPFYISCLLLLSRCHCGCCICDRCCYWRFSVYVHFEICHSSAVDLFVCTLLLAVKTSDSSCDKALSFVFTSTWECVLRPIRLHFNLSTVRIFKAQLKMNLLNFFVVRRSNLLPVNLPRRTKKQ